MKVDTILAVLVAAKVAAGTRSDLAHSRDRGSKRGKGSSNTDSRSAK